MMPNSITIVCPMKMLNIHNICINVMVQLCVSCLVTCVSRITTRRYGSRSDIVYIADST